MFNLLRIGCLLVFVAVDQTGKTENSHQPPKQELRRVAQQTIKDKQPVVVESSAYLEKQEHLNAGISTQEDVNPIHKFEQPVRPTAAAEHSPEKQEKAEPG